MAVCILGILLLSIMYYSIKKPLKPIANIMAGAEKLKVSTNMVLSSDMQTMWVEE